MRKKSRMQKFLFFLYNYAVFFLMTAFIITCCMMLFLEAMIKETGLELSEDVISTAAKLTFANVALLSLLFTVIDAVRRKITVDRPVKRITEAAQKVIKGDYTTRIKPFHGIDSADGFDDIIDYFNRMTEELMGTETLRADFISNVSHELKTPLAVMQNYAAMLQAPELPEEKRLEYARAISEASRRLAALITNILKLNKLENQQIHPMNETFDLGEQLCECLLAFEDIWEKKELEIETEIADEVWVKSDYELLSLVWNNLFSNAVKFTPQGGKVTLSLKAEGEWAVISVADTGCGISKEAGAHIFDKFYQADTSHSTQGNGLGLALVKRIAVIVGGDISVASVAGKGSVFTVRIRRMANEELEKTV